MTTESSESVPRTHHDGAQRGPNPALHPALVGVVVVLAVLGGGLIAYATRWGPWAYSDSVSYIEVARNLVSGEGLVEVRPSGNAVLFTKEPPLYPMLLAFAGRWGIDAVEAARWLDAALFTALILSLGLATLRYSRTIWIPAALSLILLSSSILLRDYTGAMSEPLFITLAVLGLILLVAYLQEPSPLLYGVSAGLIALAAVTRYAGVVVLIAAAVAILLLDTARLGRRLLGALGFLALGGAPILLWAIAWLHQTVSLRGAQPSNVGLWAALAAFRLALVNTLWDWLPYIQRFPSIAYRVKLVILVSLAAGFLILLGVTFRKHRMSRRAPSKSDAEFRLAAVFVLAGLIYIGFLAVVSLVGPWYVRIDERQLSPAFLCLCVGGFLTFGLMGDGPLAKRVWSAVQLACVVAVISSALPDALGFLQDLHRNGGGYTSRAWHSSALVKAAEEVPSGVAIISNDPEAILFYTRRPAYNLPELQTGVPSPIDEQFGSQPNDPLQRLFSQNGAALVMFKEADSRFDPLYGDQTPTRLQALVRGLDISRDLWDGTLYYFTSNHP
jgi:hypothetical protein